MQQVRCGFFVNMDKHLDPGARFSGRAGKLFRTSPNTQVQSTDISCTARYAYRSGSNIRCVFSWRCR